MPPNMPHRESTTSLFLTKMFDLIMRIPLEKNPY